MVSRPCSNRRRQPGDRESPTQCGSSRSILRLIFVEPGDKLVVPGCLRLILAQHGSNLEPQTDKPKAKHQPTATHIGRTRQLRTTNKRLYTKNGDQAPHTNFGDPQQISQNRATKNRAKSTSQPQIKNRMRKNRTKPS